MGRKTPPCLKGIETNDVLLSFVRLRRRKTPPCLKGIETYTLLPVHLTLLGVERPRPVSKGLKRITRSFSSKPLKSKDPALSQRD